MFSKVTTVEGFGSFFVHQKSIIIIAISLNASIFFSERNSTHGYNFPKILNYASFGNLVPNRTVPSCVTSDEVLNRQFITSLCKGNEHAKNYLYKRFNKCTTIIHERWETIDDLNDCIEPYISRIFPQVFDSVQYSDIKTQLLSHIDYNMATLAKVSVGIHIRWGDTSTGNLTRLDSRSIGIQHINEFYKYVFQKYNDELIYYVFMEHYHINISTLVDIKNYFIVDTGDDLFDLNLLSKMDIIMHGPSTFAVLASLISPGKLIITYNPNHTRFVYTNEKINEVISYKNNSYNMTRFIDNARHKRIFIKNTSNSICTIKNSVRTYAV